MCAVVCPFDVITFHPDPLGPSVTTAVAIKCDGCETRVRIGFEPACVDACKVDALVYGDINELVASGRLRDAGATLGAAGVVAASSSNDPLSGWRAWGTAQTSAAVSGQRRHDDGGHAREETS